MALRSAVLVQRLRDRGDLAIEIFCVIERGGDHPCWHRLMGRAGAKSPQARPLVNLAARDPGTDPFFELVLAAFAVGGFCAPALDVLDGLAGALGLASRSAVLSRLDQLLGGQRQLLVLGGVPLQRLGAGRIALRAAFARPTTGLVHRGPAFVHPHAGARHLPSSRFDVLCLGLGSGLLGRRALLARPRALPGRLSQLLMVRRLLLVGRAECLSALLVAHRALFGRPRTLTGRLVACLDIGLLIMRGGALVERMRAQLGDLRQAVLDLSPPCRLVVSLGRPGTKLVDRRPMLGGARPRLLGVTPRTQRLVPPGRSLLGRFGLFAGDRSPALGFLAVSGFATSSSCARSARTPNKISAIPPIAITPAPMKNASST